MLEGGCLCGQVRYEAGSAPFHSTVCHCSMCRRAAGAPMVAWFTVQCAQLRLVAGAPARFGSIDPSRADLLPTLRHPLTFENDECPDEIDVTTASLDDREAMPPRDHTRPKRACAGCS